MRSLTTVVALVDTEHRTDFDSRDWRKGFTALSVTLMVDFGVLLEAWLRPGGARQTLILSASNTCCHGMIFDHSEGREFVRCIAQTIQVLLSQSLIDGMYWLSCKRPFGIFKYRTVKTRLWLEYE